MAATADLAVTKVDSPDPVVAGANLTYTIGVTNLTAAEATTVSLSDTLPANTTFVSHEPRRQGGPARPRPSAGPGR